MKLFRKKSLLPGDPDRTGFTSVVIPRNALKLFDDSVVSYAELYRTSPSLKAVIRAISENGGQMPIGVYQKFTMTARRRKENRDPLVQLLNQPNERTSGYDFRRSVYADLCVFGNSYHLKVRDDAGNPRALVRVPPSLVSIESDSFTDIDSYRVMFPSGMAHYSVEDVLHVRLYNPEDSRIGLSPVEPLRALLAEEQALTEDRAGFWRNSARVGQWILRPSEAPEWSEKARKRFAQEMRNLFTGAAQAGVLGVLEDDMKPVAATFSARESELNAGRALVQQIVAVSYGVPLSLVGMGDRNTQQARRSLIQDCLVPLSVNIEEALNQQLVPDVFGSQAAFGRIFTETIIEDQIRGDLEMQGEILQRAVGGPWLTVNEARDLVNREPVDGGDELLPPPGGANLKFTLPPPEVHVDPTNINVEAPVMSVQHAAPVAAKRVKRVIVRDPETGRADAIVEQDADD
jgi:HK97 family phage portal protein